MSYMILLLLTQDLDRNLTSLGRLQQMFLQSAFMPEGAFEKEEKGVSLLSVSLLCPTVCYCALLCAPDCTLRDASLCLRWMPDCASLCLAGCLAIPRWMPRYASLDASLCLRWMPDGASLCLRWMPDCAPLYAHCMPHSLDGSLTGWLRREQCSIGSACVISEGFATEAVQRRW